MHQPNWLAPHYWKLLTDHTFPYINTILGQPAFFLDSGPLKMGAIGCPKMSVTNYHYLLWNNTEGLSYHLLCGERLKSHLCIINSWARSKAALIFLPHQMSAMFLKKFGKLIGMTLEWLPMSMWSIMNIT
jgi:hypothetical protein